MRQEQAEQICGQVKTFNSERFDGFVLVGFAAGSHEPFVIGSDYGDPMLRRALRSLLDDADEMLEGGDYALGGEGGSE